MKYEESQIGWMFIGFGLFVILIVFVLFIFQLGNKPIPLLFAVFMLLFFLLFLLLFYRLAVIVTNDFVTIKFGIGVIKKRVLIKDIESVTKARSKWYEGWGIRFVKSGTLYNIQGLNTIELNLNNKSGKVLIGTKPNTKLDIEIKRRIT